ncbi:MAG: hypothetical protein AAF623_05485 [Planctomycetota bacterium]
MRILILSLTLLVWHTADLRGQKTDTDGPVGIFQSQQEYYDFMGAAKGAAYGEGGSPELRAMIPLINDIVLNQPIGSTAGQYQTEASTLGILSNPDVRADLEMVDDQYKELQSLNQQIQNRAAEQLRNLDFSDQTGVVEQIGKIRSNTESELSSLLLPHQLKRLRQIKMQQLLQVKTLVDVLTDNPVKKELDISDEQAKDLQDADDEIQRELALKIKKLQEEAREKLIARLNPIQQAEAKELIGDAFEFKTYDGRTKKNSKRGKVRSSSKQQYKK